MNKRKLQFQQLDHKMRQLANLQRIAIPPIGWIKTIRIALGMSMQQLGKKLSITKQGVQDIEQREREGSVTLKSLREIAHALDLQFVYGFVPKDATLEALIERKARELAKQIVLRTSNSMRLEDQENTKQRIDRAIEEKVAAIKDEMPKILWD